MRAILPLLLPALVTGCLPGLESECARDEDCLAGGRCLAGVCVTGGDGTPLTEAGTDSGRNADAAGADARAPEDATRRADAAPDAGPDPRHDAAPADAGLDAAPTDAGLDAAAPDATAPDATDPDATDPDATAPDVAAPDAADPDAAAPDAAPCVPAGPEICNGEDDDCDGLVDRDPDGQPLARSCLAGPDDPVGVGVCRAGVTRCLDGNWSACDGAVGPSGEVCDGLDDDCDGLTDEGPGGQPITLACYTGPEGTEGVGACRGGTRTCSDGRLSPCRDEVVPAVELCDGVDNDCDGQVDDVPGGCAECAEGEAQPCYTGPPGTAGVGECRAGVQRCVDGRFGPCDQVLPSPEICDGRDNDCDGLIDQGLDQAPCAVGQGGCRREGVTLCEEGRERCSAEPGDPGVETCDGRDEDCDGAVDEGFPLREPCEVGVGACAATGELVCAQDGDVTCSAQPGLPSPETCNGRDDDCDYFVDEAGAEPLCVAPHATGTCDGTCRDFVCDPRWFDDDGDPGDGCERGCPPEAVPPQLGTGREAQVSVGLDGEVAIAWIGPAGRPQLSINGAASIALGSNLHVYDAPALARAGEYWLVAARRRLVIVGGFFGDPEIVLIAYGGPGANHEVVLSLDAPGRPAVTAVLDQRRIFHAITAVIAGSLEGQRDETRALIMAVTPLVGPIDRQNTQVIEVDARRDWSRSTEARPALAGGLRTVYVVAAGGYHFDRVTGHLRGPTELRYVKAGLDGVAAGSLDLDLGRRPVDLGDHISAAWDSGNALGVATVDTAGTLLLTRVREANGQPAFDPLVEQRAATAAPAMVALPGGLAVFHPVADLVSACAVGFLDDSGEWVADLRYADDCEHIAADSTASGAWLAWITRDGSVRARSTGCQ